MLRPFDIQGLTPINKLGMIASERDCQLMGIALCLTHNYDGLFTNPFGFLVVVSNFQQSWKFINRVENQQSWKSIWKVQIIPPWSLMIILLMNTSEWYKPIRGPALTSYTCWLFKIDTRIRYVKMVHSVALLYCSLFHVNCIYSAIHVVNSFNPWICYLNMTYKSHVTFYSR